MYLKKHIYAKLTQFFLLFSSSLWAIREWPCGRACKDPGPLSNLSAEHMCNKLCILFGFVIFLFWFVRLFLVAIEQFFKCIYMYVFSMVLRKGQKLSWKFYNHSCSCRWPFSALYNFCIWPLSTLYWSDPFGYRVLLDYLYINKVLYVPLNFSLIWRHHHCPWRAAKFRPMLGAKGVWAGRDLYHATLPVTLDLGFYQSHPKDCPILIVASCYTWRDVEDHYCNLYPHKI